MTERKDSATMEIEAESIAFIVCSHLNLDCSDYSFSYLATWSSDKELPELQKSLSTIQKTAHDLIDKLDQAIARRSRDLSIEEPEIPALPDTHRHRR